MRPDNDTPEQPESIQPEQNQSAQKQPEQETLQQEQREQTQSARQRAEPESAPRRAAAPSAMLPVTPANAPASPDICARLQPDLKAYQDGQAGWWQRREIGRHLARCAVCREEIEAMREFSDRWRGADAEVLDPNLRARILAAVPDTRPAASAVAPPRRGSLPLALAGAGMCAILGGIALYPVVMSKTDRAMQSDATRTLSAPSASVAADAGQARSRSESYAAGAAMNSKAAFAPFASGNGPMPAAPAMAAKPGGTQMASARQFPSDQNGSAPGELDRTTRSRDANGPAASGRMQADGQRDYFRKSTRSATGTASPPPTASAESAMDNAPVMSDAAGGSPPASRAMSKTSAPASLPSPAPSDKTASAAGTEAAARPRRTDHRQTDHNQTAGSFAQARPDPEKQSNAAKQVVLPTRIAEEPRKYKTALLHNTANKAANKEGEAAKAVASASAMPPPARPTAAARARRPLPQVDTSAVTLKMRVAQTETAAAVIEQNARALGGTVVTSETTTDAGGAKSATLRLKVPSANLDTFLAQAAQTGTVVSKTVSPARSEAADAATNGHVRAFAAQNGSQAQTANANITVVLQPR